LEKKATKVSDVHDKEYQGISNGVYRCLLYLGDLARYTSYSINCILLFFFNSLSFDTDIKNFTRNKIIKTLQTVFVFMKELL
jgi:hypothetical protein